MNTESLNSAAKLGVAATGAALLVLMGCLTVFALAESWAGVKHFVGIDYVYGQPWWVHATDWAGAVFWGAVGALFVAFFVTLVLAYCRLMVSLRRGERPW